MIPARAGQSRLLSQLAVSRCPYRSGFLIRRAFSSSVSRRCPDGPCQDQMKESLEADSRRTKGANKLGAKTPGSHQTGPASGRPKSRLSSLKKKGDAKGSSQGERFIFGKSTDIPIRTRFAPSPTGYLHLGSLRTALFNNLLSKATKGGDFIIRIEDTDRNRLVPDAEERLLKDLEWAGLEWSEGPDKGGPYGPYRQSERLETYNHHTQMLLDNGSAYRCFCSPSALEAQNRAAHEAGQPTVYPGTCRSIPREESDARAAKGEPHVVRLNAGKFGTPAFQDAIYGPMQKKQGEEDFVLMKTDGYPTYHLANVVDDHLMKITHVVRGEEWLISTPKHIALYQAFGWEPPTFAHLALLVSNDGSKLSKRNDSVNLSTYQAKHVFPMALQAWLANLGSSFRNKVPTPRTIKDIADALTFKFTRGGIKLNHEKLTFFQSAYRTLLFATPPSDLTTSETALIRSNLVLPLLDEVLSITASPTSAPTIHPENARLSWPSHLTLVPSLQTSPPVQEAYILALLTHGGARFDDPRAMASLQPYLFWRPPLAVYRASIAAYPPTPELLSAVRDALHSQVDVQEALKARVPADAMPDAHALIRLILIGDPAAFSRNSGLMVQLLGVEECRHRVDVVSELVEELGKGGEELKKQWIEVGKTLESVV